MSSKPITQLERSKTITYRWWRASKKGINPDHIEALEAAADARIAEMTAQGYISGELNGDEDGVEYTGWWEVK
jgi:hypothetical protein